ncbi:zinc ribbon-containing protein [Aeromonas caviae]|uniref:hypothetical protein n=1 Tax=Aeromonas caviae TaxID=648 RepID=UPI002B47F09A|nr:hypothetical protein [Aeromonas caviae]
MALRDRTQNKVKLADEKSQTHFQKIQNTGSKPNFPGIYECQSCGFEDLINRDCEKLPPCSECDGSEWKLIVYAQNSKQKGGKTF